MILDQITEKKDEYYTPPYAVEPILEYIPADATVWCPFDTRDSFFVRMLRAKGCKVIATHLDDGIDFFDYEYECDYIVSNPPYSLKSEVLEALFASKTPFAMLIGVVGIFESQHRFKLFRDNVFEIMYLNKRVSFFESFTEGKPARNPPFSSVYITSNMLPEKIMFAEIDKNFVKL
jgi:hypothetical protein